MIIIEYKCFGNTLNQPMCMYQAYIKCSTSATSVKIE